MKRTRCDDVNISQSKKGNLNFALNRDTKHNNSVSTLVSNFGLKCDPINYCSLPTLENITIVNLAIELCSQSDIKDKFLEHSQQFDPGQTRCFSSWREESFSSIEKSMSEKLHLLPLPNLLKFKTANIFQPLARQIIEWIIYHKDVEYIDSICWTVNGLINEVKTIEQLIAKNSEKYSDVLYSLACKYCLEDHIPYLWRKLPEEKKNVYLSHRTRFSNYGEHLLYYWTSVANNKSVDILDVLKSNDYNSIYNTSHSIFKNMFSLALSVRNNAAVQYFWKKLTEDEVNSNLMSWINILLEKHISQWFSFYTVHESANTLFFLLSQVNYGEQKEIFKKHSELILNSLICWPWETFLLPTLRVMWEFIDEIVYFQFMSRVVNEIKEGKTAEKLFVSLWCETPKRLQTRFVNVIIKNDRHGSNVLCNLMIVNDLNTVEMLLHDINIEEKKHILFSLIRNDKFSKLILKGNFDILNELALKILDESEFYELKRTLIQTHGKILGKNWIVGDNWEMLEKLFCWAFTSQEEINDFKKVIDAFDITFSLLCAENYKLLDQFINWHLNSEEVRQFKRDFASANLKILKVVGKGQSSFEKYINWCFTCDEDLKEFKLKVLQSSFTHDIIFDIIVYSYDFKCVENLMKWCSNSDEDIKQFKEKFVLSDTFGSIIQRFVSNYKVYDSDYSNWQLTEMLIELFCPIGKEVIIKLKELFIEIDFENYKDYYYPHIEEKDLLDMICKYSKIGENEKAIIFENLNDNSSE